LLENLTTYEIVVIDGQRTNDCGIIGSGPTDLVDRPLTSPFVARFTTADLSAASLFTPENGAIQVDTRSASVIIRSLMTGFTIVLTGPGGPVQERRTWHRRPGLVFPERRAAQLIFSVTVNGTRSRGTLRRISH
jgi:hypothetical protein